MRPRTEWPWAADAALVAGVVCIAWSGLLVRWAAVSGFTAAFYRMAFAAAVLAPLSVLRSAVRRPAGGGATSAGRRMRRPYPAPGGHGAGWHAAITLRVWFLAAVAGALFSCDNVLFNVAVQRSPVGVATLLANLSPVFVGLGAWLIVGERPSRSFWTGLVLAAVGSACIGGGERLLATGGHGPSGGGGAVLAIVASVFFAGYLMVVARARESADTLTFTTLSVCWSALLLGIACLALGEPLHGFAPHSWAALVALGLVSQTGGYLAIIYALGRLPATVTSVALLAQAPVTAVIAAVVLGEGLSAMELVGGVLTLAGIYVVTRHAARSVGEPSPVS